MSNTKHTNRTFSYSAIDNLILEKHPQRSTTVVCEIAKGANELINKRLIAAAPDLLDAIIELKLSAETQDSVLNSDIIDICVKALVKAKGGE